MRDERKEFSNGAVYETVDCLSFGDYGGAGSVGRANINALQEEFAEDRDEFSMSTWNMGQELVTRREPSYSSAWEDIAPTAPLVTTYGAYSSEQAWLRVDGPFEERAREILDALEDYPLICEDAISEVELEWESEAWDNWLRSDLMRTLPDDEPYRFDDLTPDDAPTLRELAEELDAAELFRLYRAAMDTTNTYPEPEYNGVHVDVRRIADEFRAEVEDALRDRTGQLELPADEDTATAQ